MLWLGLQGEEHTHFTGGSTKSRKSLPFPPSNRFALRSGWAGKERNFDRLPVDLVDTLGLQYDYESIMHYSRTAFSFNGQPTVLPKRDPFANLGQRDGFSHGDIEKINRLYRCGRFFYVGQSS